MGLHKYINLKLQNKNKSPPQIARCSSLPPSSCFVPFASFPSLLSLIYPSINSLHVFQKFTETLSLYCPQIKVIVKVIVNKNNKLNDILWVTKCIFMNPHYINK